MPHCLRQKMSVPTLPTLNEWLFGMNLIRIHTHNILFQSVSYSIMIYVLWVFFILLWKRTKIIKLYPYHSTISFASLTWTQVQLIFTVTTVLQTLHWSDQIYYFFVWTEKIMKKPMRWLLNFEWFNGWKHNKKPPRKIHPFLGSSDRTVLQMALL